MAIGLSHKPGRRGVWVGLVVRRDLYGESEGAASGGTEGCPPTTPLTQGQKPDRISANGRLGLVRRGSCVAVCFPTGRGAAITNCPDVS